MSKNRLTPFYKPYNRNMKRVYVSGPMTGYPNNNFPAFQEAANDLRGMGYSVCSPAETDVHLGIGALTHEQYLRFDFERVLEADFVVALPGWEDSLGSLSEILVAVRIGTKVWQWDSFDDFNAIGYEQVVAAMSTNGNAVRLPFDEQRYPQDEGNAGDVWRTPWE